MYISLTWKIQFALKFQNKAHPHLFCPLRRMLSDKILPPQKSPKRTPTSGVYRGFIEGISGFYRGYIRVLCILRSSLSAEQSRAFCILRLCLSAEQSVVLSLIVFHCWPKNPHRIHYRMSIQGVILQKHSHKVTNFVILWAQRVEYPFPRGG